MRRKFLAVLALAAAGILMLTACSSSGSGNTAEGQNSATEVVGDVKETEEIQKDTAKEDTADAGKAGSAQEAEEDIWSGTYTGDQENITVTRNDDGTISFRFTQSGISGDAVIDGNQAVYHGDDDHILTFRSLQGILNVTVEHAEGYDTSASPLNGNFVPSY